MVTIPAWPWDRSPAPAALGLMIPPSISMIIYGVLAEQSITALFAAGILPGLLISGIYSAYIVFRALGGNVTGTGEDAVRYTAADYLRSILDLLPVVGLIFIVLGGIYAGVVTPSEAAALGFAASLFLVILLGQFRLSIFVDALMGATRITCMVMTILVAAGFMSSTMAYLHVPQEISKLIAAMELGPVGIIVLIGVFYVLLGMFLDGLSIMVMTLPITLPLIVGSGWDPIWFGVFLVIMIELGLITPPIGFNLFVMQGITGRSIGEIARGALPFFLLMLLSAVIITVFPALVLWLPEILF